MPLIILGETLYSLSETADMLEVTPRTVYAYIANGRIKAQKIGQGWRFTEDSIKDFITASRMDEPPTPERRGLTRQKINAIIARHEKANIQQDKHAMKLLEDKLTDNNAHTICECIASGEYTRARDAAREL